MTDDLWVSEDHPISGRTAVVEDAGHSVWLYLTEPGGAPIAADCWLLNRVPAPEAVDEAAAAQGPPPAVAAVVGEGAHRPAPIDPATVRFRWSADGESVAALIGDEPVGCIVAGRERGMSRHLRLASPWGEPLDAAVYDATFGDDG